MAFVGAKVCIYTWQLSQMINPTPIINWPKEGKDISQTDVEAIAMDMVVRNQNPPVYRIEILYPLSIGHGLVEKAIERGKAEYARKQGISVDNPILGDLDQIGIVGNSAVVDAVHKALTEVTY